MRLAELWGLNMPEGMFSPQSSRSGRFQDVEGAGGGDGHGAARERRTPWDRESASEPTVRTGGARRRKRGVAAMGVPTEANRAPTMRALGSLRCEGQWRGL